jgi:FKBP-type peptidyl-prolyl cis-trans isomerase FklB
MGLVGLLLAFAPALRCIANEPAPATVVKEVQLSFKRDPRLVDPYRGIAPWVTGSNYQGATAQDTVEIRAEGVSATGKPVTINPEWTVSDPDMLTVSPNRGNDVSVTVHRPGEGRLKATYQGSSKEVVFNAKFVGKFLLFVIVPPKAGAPTGPKSAALGGVKQQVSYAAGVRLARTLRAQAVEVEPDLVKKGIEDVLSGNPTLMSDGEVSTALAGVETELNITEAVIARERRATENKVAGEKFLAANRHKKGVVTLPSGLQYKVIAAGTGEKPTATDVAFCHYRGILLDGTEFDNSYKRKHPEPVRFPVRAVIKGWQEALQLMPAGSKWQLFVPPDLAYGERGIPRANIPPNATLVFEVELLSVNQPPRVASAGETTALGPEGLAALKVVQKQANAQSAEEIGQ